MASPLRSAKSQRRRRSLPAPRLTPETPYTLHSQTSPRSDEHAATKGSRARRCTHRPVQRAIRYTSRTLTSASLNSHCHWGGAIPMARGRHSACIKQEQRPRSHRQPTCAPRQHERRTSSLALTHLHPVCYTDTLPVHCGGLNSKSADFRAHLLRHTHSNILV